LSALELVDKVAAYKKRTLAKPVARSAETAKTMGCGVVAWPAFLPDGDDEEPEPVLDEPDPPEPPEPEEDGSGATLTP